MIVQSPNTRSEFKALIQENKNKTIVVKFYANWCMPCKKINSLVYELFEKINNSKLMILVNIDEQSDISSFLKITQIPTIMTYKNGERDNAIVSSDEEELTTFFSKI